MIQWCDVNANLFQSLRTSMQRFLKWTSVQTCPNPICYIFVGFPIWVSGISDTGKRCFGIRGLECCFSLIGVGFPNLGIRSAEAPQILDVCVWMQETTGPPSNGNLFGFAYCPAHGNSSRRTLFSFAHMSGETCLWLFLYFQAHFFAKLFHYTFGLLWQRSTELNIWPFPAEAMNV